VGTGAGGLCLGVAIGGTKTPVGLVDADHRVLDVREAPTPTRDGRSRARANTGPLQLTAGGVPIHPAARGLT
jgi:predicted NBD/HSP70 family sugar kinase